MKRLLSLFDTTGHWPAPFAAAGWDIIHVDLQNWCALDINSIRTAEDALEVFDDVDGILAAPPCTDYAVSGAQYWLRKDQDGRTELSNRLIRQVLRLVDLYFPTDPEYDGTFFWSLENPVGRLPKLFPALGKPRIYFDPCDYAGWLKTSKADLARLEAIRTKNGQGVTAREAELIMRTETYTKKTGLWGNFAIPEKKPVEPVKGAPTGSPIMRAGGTSQATKNYRSATPLGFAQAFYEANKDYRPETWNQDED